MIHLLSLIFSLEAIAKLQALAKMMILSQFARAAQRPEPHRRGHTRLSRTRRWGGKMAQKGVFAWTWSFAIASLFISFCLAADDKKITDKFFILTGGPGSGKTTLIEELKKRGLYCVDEVARKIIQEEMALGGDALPGDNIGIRIEKMLLGSIETYQEAVKEGRVTLFDRGTLDYLGYAYRTNTPISEELHQKASELVYNKKLFITPPWEEIYCNDTERKQSFEEAVEVYHSCFKLYAEHGYEVIELPKADVMERADFIMRHIGKSI
jgi:predicted ATPase